MKDEVLYCNISGTQMWGSASTSKNILNTLKVWRCSLNSKLEENVDPAEVSEIMELEVGFTLLI